MQAKIELGISLLLMILLVSCTENQNASTGEGQIAPSKVFEEVDGVVAVEAEHFLQNSPNNTERAWYPVSEDLTPEGATPANAVSASNNAFVQGLPDTRVTHDDSLIVGINFYPEPGIGPILSYDVWFNTPGIYTVWVRAYSTGTEDNGIHVGIDGEWPELGQRIQWCEGKGEWTWSAAQRRPENHCGVPNTIQLDVKTSGEHTISFSMREDGFAFDKWIMMLDGQAIPEGEGPDERIRNY